MKSWIRFFRIRAILTGAVGFGETPIMAKKPENNMPNNAIVPAQTAKKPEPASTALAALRRRVGNDLNALPDTPRYKVRFDVRSQSTNQLYRVSFDAAAGAGYWVCSCRGCIMHGSCKHLEAAGLRGKKYGKDLTTLKALGL
jgi:hypothetical protein